MNKKGEVSLKENFDGSRQLTGKLYQGIFPPPEMLKEYKEIDPELPNRLIRYAEDEANFRRKMDNKVINSTAFLVLMGVMAGLIALLALCFLSYQYLQKDYATEGAVIAASIAAVVGIFVLRKFLPGNKNE